MKKKIAVLDDDPIIRGLVKGLLTKYDFEVLSYETDEELFDVNSGFDEVDLLLLDIHLGEVNGIDVLEDIKSNTEFHKLPVIMLTSDSKDRTLEECFMLGACDYILKPFKALSLKSRIQAALERAKKYESLEQEIAILTESITTINGLERNDALERGYRERIRNLEQLQTEFSATTNHLAAVTWREKKKNEELIKASAQLEDVRAYSERSSIELECSLTYAKKAQSAFLPGAQKLRALFSESFVMSIPKEEVSGDFYWCHQVGERLFLGVFDCTGHGIPGAFISIIGLTLLNDIVKVQGILEVDEILKRLHEGVYHSLNQDYSDSNDGIDAALCCVHQGEQILTFCGANIPLVYIENGIGKSVSGEDFTIGGKRLLTEDTLTVHTFDKTHLQRMYLFTDGFYKQKGGKGSEPLGLGRIVSFVEGISGERLEVQMLKLNQLFQDWTLKQSEKIIQQDDLLLVGVAL